MLNDGECHEAVLICHKDQIQLRFDAVVQSMDLQSHLLGLDREMSVHVGESDFVQP